MATKTYLIKETGHRHDEANLVLLVTLVTPPKKIGDMVLLSVEQPQVIEIPTTMDTLVADLKAYKAGNTVSATFGAPVAAA